MTGGRATLEQAAEGKTGGGGASGNAIKVTIVVVALIVAGVLLAWHFGAFDKPEVVVPVEQQLDEEGKAQLQKSQEMNKKLERINKSPAGS
jgi:hypothetical protein